MSSKSSFCPRCGQTFLAGASGVCYNCERIESEQKRYGRRRPLPPEREEPPVKRPLQSSRRVNQARGMVRFLSELCGQPKNLGQFLTECGFQESTVSRLKACRILYQKDVCRHWCHLLRELIDLEKAELVVECFQLDGSPALSDERARKIFQLSRLESLREARLEVERLSKHRRKFEAVLVWVALGYDGLGECA